MNIDASSTKFWAKWDQLLQAVEGSSEDVVALLEPCGRMIYVDEQIPQSDHFVLFKGSFSPIHNGHVSLFNAAVEKATQSTGAFALSFVTFKRLVARQDLVFRSRLIHLAGYPVIVSRSGRFSHIAAFFRQLSPTTRLVFPVGIDVLLRTLEYYDLKEFEMLFQNASFEYFRREGFDRELPGKFSNYPRVHFLGTNLNSSINSTKLWQLRDQGQENEVRSSMPEKSAEYFLSSGPETRDSFTTKTATAPSWPFIPGKKTFEVVHAEGSYLYLRDGRRILDAAGGAGVVNIGHGRPEVVHVISQTLRNLSYAAPGFATPERLALIEHLQTHWLPAHLRRVNLIGSGSDAVEAAVRLARKYQVACGRLGRWKTIGREVSYHGATLGSLSISGHEARRARLGPLLRELPHAPACYCLRCSLGQAYPQCEVACAQALEEVIKKEGAETIAAFIAEPIVGASGGALVPPDEYWPMIQDICRRHNILVIADEITTGFGRTGRRFAVEFWNVSPDILVVGKGLTGGYAPLAALFTTDTVVETLAAAGMSLLSHTFDGHPSSCAAAKSVLEIILQERHLDRVSEKGELLGQLLTSTLGDHPHVAQIRGRGLLWAVEIVQQRSTLERFPQFLNVTRKVVHKSIEMGVFFYPGGTSAERDIIILSPPYIVEREEINEMVRVLKSALDQVIGELPCD